VAVNPETSPRIPASVDQLVEDRIDTSGRPTTSKGTKYLTLVRRFRLLSIRDDAHLAEALEVIDRLVEKPTRSEDEDAYLGTLTDLVETYENAHVMIPQKSGVDAVRYLMAENRLSQDDLAPLFGSPSIISEVLAGKRHLTLAHMKKLAERFGVPIDVFAA
jgi:HTH-type transcriptional regulator / antitoxin HigA